MPWEIFTGTGTPKTAEAWRAIPPPPPWRDRAATSTAFVTTPELLDAVNTALHLRRPLLLTGPAGSGKSTLAGVIANELQLGQPLEWHVTSLSSLNDALFQYDALGRLHATQAGLPDSVEQFVTLGPLGTALAAEDHPRVVLIDEIDKSDQALPGDLLHVLELGEFDIPALIRAARGPADNGAASVSHKVRGIDGTVCEVAGGVVRRRHLPVIILTSNGEQSFSDAFLRRCIRFKMPTPSVHFLESVVDAHLAGTAEREKALIESFAARLLEGRHLALDQLLGMVYLVTGEAAPGSEARARVEQILLKDLSGQ